MSCSVWHTSTGQIRRTGAGTRVNSFQAQAKEATAHDQTDPLFQSPAIQMKQQSMEKFNYKHPEYRRARAKAFQRSNGTCQFCGLFPAVESHHWTVEYPLEEDTGADHLTALCKRCHDIATFLRTHMPGEPFASPTAWGNYSGPPQFQNAPYELQEELEQIRIKAERGEAAPNELFRLGLAYCMPETGRHHHLTNSQKESHAEAVRWFTEAAKQGHAEAQYELGSVYDRKGGGVGQDHAEAVHWFTEAAKQGHAEAQYQLGNAYMYGDVMEQSDTKAMIWWTQAAIKGHVQAQTKLGRLYELGCFVEIEGGTDYRTTFSGGKKREQHGLTVGEDLAEAARWYRKAADRGDAGAQSILGYAYIRGEGVEKNLTEAARWLRKAAKQGEYWAKKALQQHDLE